MWEMDSGKQSTSVISGLEEASPEPVGAQVSVEESQEELTSGLDVGECEKRAREMLRVGRDADVTTVSSGGRASSRPSPPLGPVTFPHLEDVRATLCLGLTMACQTHAVVLPSHAFALKYFW